MNSEDNICIQFDCDADDLEVDWRRLESLVRSICKECKLNSSADIHINIVNDEEIIEVHRQFLQKDTTTDVISFDLSDEFEDKSTFQCVVNADMAKRQSQQRNHTLEAELALYITHGMLHNLGFDDTDKDQSKLMHEKEDEILQKNEYGIVYHTDPGQP